jgi:hypothetical protein
MTKMLVTLRVDEYTRRQKWREQGGDAPGSEGTVERVLDVDDIEAPDVLLAVDDDTSTAHVAAAGDDAQVARVKLDKVDDLGLLEVELDRVVDRDRGVGVADGAAVVGDDVGDTTGADRDLAHLEELVGGLLGGDAVDGEAALNVVEETEVLARLFDGDDIHEASRVRRVGADLAVDFDEPLLDDREHFLARQRVL